ncbi:MAG TPA: DUF4450 domain-containing protein, partial [Candidatus Hydrogenedentes bacterium]|nr:DUF4450 domain-containing protein [Candidatus Hydrogenedentota bacterium]
MKVKRVCLAGYAWGCLMRSGLMRIVLMLGMIGLWAVAEGSDPKEFDVFIEAEAFARGSVQGVEGRGWADAGGMIQCADASSPDWAEWDFSASEDGLYLVYAKVAAESSRPVEMWIDGRLVSRNALAQTTGDWRLSSARWFGVGMAALDAGGHTLRIWRATCIPHIDAFGLRRMSAMAVDEGPFLLPEEVWLEDGYARQDWMIWSIGGTQAYDVVGGAFHIHNGRHTLNRPLYGSNDAETVFVGDRPLVMLTYGPKAKLGVLAARIGMGGERKWLEEADSIDFYYDGATARWEIQDDLLGSEVLVLEVVPLIEVQGFMVRASVDTAVHVSWWFGGLDGAYPDNKAGHGAMPGGRDESHCRDDEVDVVTCSSADARILASDAVKCIGRVSSRSVSPGEVFVSLSPLGDVRADRCRSGPFVLLDRMITYEKPVYAVVSTSKQALCVAMDEPDVVWGRACSYYDAVAGRLSVETPEPVLDEAMRANNASMDGQYRPPSFLHGALRWGTECEGWYLGWRGWYGPIVAGDFERVAGAARFHFEHQYTSPATGLDSAGKVAPFVRFDGREKRAVYNMHEVFLDHLRSYYWWTGDDGLMIELWPKIKVTLAYQRREIGKDLDGLYTNAVNTWISDGHHYNGNACTQASAYAVRHNRWAAQVAALAGDDALFYTSEAERTRDAMRERLWMEDKGYYAEYVDRDGVLHDAAEAATIYHAVEMGAADVFESYQMTRYVDERLWRFGDQILANDWYPVIVTCGLIGFNESLNTALAYYHAGRFERAWRLLKVCCDSTAKATVPGSISCYGSREGAQGVYVDFTDASSMFARTVVEGLFGLQPRLDEGRIEWSPRFPRAWETAALDGRGVSVKMWRHGNRAHYRVTSAEALEHRVILPADFGALASLCVNGEAVEGEWVEGLLRPYLCVSVGEGTRSEIEVVGEGALPTLSYPERVAIGDVFRVVCEGGRIAAIRDPQGIFTGGFEGSATVFEAGIEGASGWRTAFAKVQGGPAPFWAPMDIELAAPAEVINPRLAAVAGVERLGLRFELRNNRAEPLMDEAVVHFGGQTYALSLDVPGLGGREVGIALTRDSGITPG